MGSLPNLHELKREKLSSSPVVYRPTIKQQQQQQPTQQTTAINTSHKRTRSTGHHHHHAAQLWDNDAMLEHMATYSPISNRSVRASAQSWRRRDSMNSSAGASSVRRLIAAVRSAPSGPRPPKKAVLRHCAAVMLGHAGWSASTLPVFPQQAGLGVFDPVHGPIYLGLLFVVAAVTSCLAPLVVHRLGSNLTICIGHAITLVFVAVHFYPEWYLLILGYSLLGAWMSPSFLARSSHVNVSAASLSLVCSDPEDPDETRRDCVLRRLYRGLKLAEDLGLAFGCLVAYVLLRLTDPRSEPPLAATSRLGIEETCGAEYCPLKSYNYDGLVDYGNESSTIGSIGVTTNAIVNAFTTLSTVSSTSGENLPLHRQPAPLPVNTARLVLSVWLGLAILALGISCAFLDSRLREPQNYNCNNGNGSNSNEQKSIRSLIKLVKTAFQDPMMQLIAPFTLFVGFEQGFIYSDFTEAYIMCALGGAGKVSLSFLSLGLLQGLAGATLSMLMRHIKRHYVILVGFAFHACLLLVLLIWKPAEDDPALFHVISAAWGVCNAIWETLIYTLIMGLFPNSWQGPLATSLFWRWLGLGLSLGVYGLNCTRLRVLALAAMLLLSVLPYTWLEIRLAKRGKIS